MKKLQKSYKSNTRIYDDGSIEVDPQAQGEPSQKDVKKVGKSKRYITSGKNPLTCVELKCPEDEFLVNKDNLKVCFAAKEGKVTAWLTFETKGLLEVRRELYSLTSEIDKCFVINSDSICPQQ